MVGESESSSLGINESYIQSDIANIIHKMYSPHVDMEENTLSDGRCGIVVEKVSSNREIYWQENERTSRRFGHYFETETRNHPRTMMLDSSSSGSVSLPSVRHKPIRSGTYACKCCRRKISNRLLNKKVSSNCGNCRMCTKVLHPQTNIRADCVMYDSEDFSREQRLSTNQFKQIQSEQTEKKSSVVLNWKQKGEEENINDNAIALENSRDREKLLVRDPEINRNKNQSKTLLSRVFSSLIGIASFDKNSKSQTDIKVYDNEVNISSQTHGQKVKVLQLELGTQPSNSTVQKQQYSKGLASAKPNNRRVNSMMSDDCKFNLHLENIPSRDDKFKLLTASCEQSSQKCQEVLQESSDAAKEPVVKSMACMSKSGELCLGNEPVRSKTKSKAQLQHDTKNPNWADAYRLDLDDQQLLRTTATGLLADRSEDWADQFWARVFGHGHLVLSFVTAFALQLFRFMLQGLVRPLVWGSLQLACDHCLKPFLTVLFDGLLQPVLRLLQNVACSARDVARPLAEAVGFFVGEMARLLAACRLVEVHAPDTKVP